MLVILLSLACSDAPPVYAVCAGLDGWPPRKPTALVGLRDGDALVFPHERFDIVCTHDERCRVMVDEVHLSGAAACSAAP